MTLPFELAEQGWKAKIRDKERAESPHVTILRKKKQWRWGLREQDFLENDPPKREVPEELLDFLSAHLKEIIKEWDEMYPHNVVYAEGGVS